MLYKNKTIYKEITAESLTLLSHRIDLNLRVLLLLLLFDICEELTI
jgi:hypothetical protein